MSEDKLNSQEGIDKLKDLEKNVLREPEGGEVIVEKEIIPEETREKERTTERRKEAIRKSVHRETEIDETQRETIDEIKKEVRKSGPLDIPSNDQIVERLIGAIKDDDNRHNLENALRAAREMGESLFDDLVGRIADDDVWKILKEKGYIEYLD
jgi:hypothetical protein